MAWAWCAGPKLKTKGCWSKVASISPVNIMLAVMKLLYSSTIFLKLSACVAYDSSFFFLAFTLLSNARAGACSLASIFSDDLSNLQIKEICL